METETASSVDDVAVSQAVQAVRENFIRITTERAARDKKTIEAEKVFLDDSLRKMPEIDRPTEVERVGFDSLFYQNIRKLPLPPNNDDKATEAEHRERREQAFQDTAQQWKAIRIATQEQTPVAQVARSVIQRMKARAEGDETLAEQLANLTHPEAEKCLRRAVEDFLASPGNPHARSLVFYSDAWTPLEIDESDSSAIERAWLEREKKLKEASKRYSQLLQSTGKHGRELEKQYRPPSGIWFSLQEKEDSEKLFELLRHLTGAIWLDKVAPRIERERTATSSPSLCFPVLGNYVAMARRGVEAGAQRSLLNPDRMEIHDPRGKQLGSLRDTPLIDDEHVKLVKLESLAKLSTQRLIRWLVHTGWQQKYIDIVPDASKIIVDGGYSELVNVLGMRGKKAAEEIRDALHTLSSLYINSPKGEGQVFAFHHHYAGQRGRSHRLEMTLLGPFAPDYVSRELSEHPRAADKWLVPIPLPHNLPPMVGRPREHVAEAHLQLLTLREMRVHAEELAEAGSIMIEEKRWKELADEASLPSKLIPKVLDAYPQGDEERPAFLEMHGPWRFSLAEAYEKEKRAILLAAAAQTRSRRGGKARARQRYGLE